MQTATQAAPSTNALDGIIEALSSLSLNSKRYVADILNAQIRQEEKPRKLVFPKLARDPKTTHKAEALVIGPLPDGVDFDVETEKMWEEWAK